jgi:hypothetical protein
LAPPRVDAVSRPFHLTIAAAVAMAGVGVRVSADSNLALLSDRRAESGSQEWPFYRVLARSLKLVEGGNTWSGSTVDTLHDEGV